MVTVLEGRPRPVPLRPLGVAEIMDGAVRLVRGNFRAALTISVPVATVVTVFGALLDSAAIGSGAASTPLLFAGVLTQVFTATVLTGLLAPVFSGDLIGVALTARASLIRIGRAGGTLALLALVVTVVEGAGLIVLGVGGVWLWGIWAVAAPACVLERTGVRGALGRSFGLVQNSFWRTWGIRALGWTLTSVLGLFITLPIEGLAALVTGSDPSNSNGILDPNVYVAIIAIGTLLSAALLAPISSAVDVLLYTELRMRREGMDIVLALPPLPPPPNGPVTAW